MDIKKREKAIEDLREKLSKKLDSHFSSLSKPVLKNIVETVIGLAILLRTPRGWYGRITLSGIGRCMQTSGTIKSKYKRLIRFLTNKRFKTDDTIAGLFHLTSGLREGKILPLLIDQTTIRDVQVISASFPYNGRSIPIAMEAFEYKSIKFSQNLIEMNFFLKLRRVLVEERMLLLIMDRGYAKVEYLPRFNKNGLLYIIRGCSNLKIEYREGGKSKKIGLGRLPHQQGKAKRYRNVLYHSKKKQLVDIIVYRGKDFKEPWFLIVPPKTEDILPAEEVVEWYRTRMNIEVKFRDFKSCLGVRGLKLQAKKAEKIERLLVCLAIVYILLIIIGDSELGRQLRKKIEIPRKKCRHGTRRTLSVLSIALLMITDSFLLTFTELMKVLSSILSSSTQGFYLLT
jgi:hypothetical protein